jgi:hypothetical protein
MKTKKWRVITNTGEKAVLESGLEQKEVVEPTHISAKDFIHWLAARVVLMTILCAHYSNCEALTSENAIANARKGP